MKVLPQAVFATGAIAAHIIDMGKIDFGGD